MLAFHSVSLQFSSFCLSTHAAVLRDLLLLSLSLLACNHTQMKDFCCTCAVFLLLSPLCCPVTCLFILSLYSRLCCISSSAALSLFWLASYSLYSLCLLSMSSISCVHPLHLPGMCLLSGCSAVSPLLSALPYVFSPVTLLCLLSGYSAVSPLLSPWSVL